MSRLHAAVRQYVLADYLRPEAPTEHDVALRARDFARRHCLPRPTIAEVLATLDAVTRQAPDQVILMRQGFAALRAYARRELASSRHPARRRASATPVPQRGKPL